MKEQEGTSDEGDGFQKTLGVVFSAFMFSLIIAIFLLKAGIIGVEEPAPGPPSSYEQVCKECGTVWIITPTKPGQEERPVVEWCFNDGGYCEGGLSLLLDSTGGSEGSGVEMEFLSHCMTCKGCRFAAFQPEDWKKVTDAIKKIRKQ